MNKDRAVEAKAEDRARVDPFTRRIMARIFKFRGKTVEELKQMSKADLLNLMDSRVRRSLKRGYTPEQKKLLERIQKAAKLNKSKPIKTHIRSLVITPDLFGLKLMVHSGKEYVPVEITEDKIGHRLWEFTRSKKDVQHKAPGIGATKGSKSVSVK